MYIIVNTNKHNIQILKKLKQNKKKLKIIKKHLI